MPPMDNMPQGGMDPMMGNNEQMPMDGGTDPMMGNEDGMPQDNNFGGGFDPGVEANEETDPQKFIQQLTGKLSQSLKKYNDENPDDEDGLNKYVAGMVATQAAKGLTEPEKNEIIKKINTGDTDEDDSNEELPEDEMDKEDVNTSEEMPMESKRYRFSKKQLVENFLLQEPRGGEEKKVNNKKSPNVKSNIRYGAFNAPTFNSK
jgi:hypothetical protein